jgi:hypothetical protein
MTEKGREGDIMAHTTINRMKLNDVIREITLNSRNDNFAQYRYDCDNCSLSILTASHEFSSRKNTIEVAIKTKDFSSFIRVNPFGDEYENEEKADEYWDSECAIMHAFPIVGLPLLLMQFSHCSEEYIDELWRGFYLIEGAY